LLGDQGEKKKGNKNGNQGKKKRNREGDGGKGMWECVAICVVSAGTTPKQRKRGACRAALTKGKVRGPTSTRKRRDSPTHKIVMGCREFMQNKARRGEKRGRDRASFGKAAAPSLFQVQKN